MGAKAVAWAASQLPTKGRSGELLLNLTGLFGLMTPALLQSRRLTLRLCKAQRGRQTARES